MRRRARQRGPVRVQRLERQRVWRQARWLAPVRQQEPVRVRRREPPRERRLARRRERLQEQRRARQREQQRVRRQVRQLCWRRRNR